MQDAVIETAMSMQSSKVEEKSALLSLGHSYKPPFTCHSNLLNLFAYGVLSGEKL